MRFKLFPSLLLLIACCLLTTACEVKKEEPEEEIENPLPQNPGTDRPSAPLLTAIVPVGPANNNNPQISGTADADVTVKIYRDSSCSDLVGTGTADSTGAFSITVAVANNSTSQFFARAVDSQSRQSGCASSNLSYTEITPIPTAPIVSGVTPTGPANNNAPVVSGTAAAGMTVNIYSDSACSTLLTSTTANGSGNFSASPSVVDNSSTTFYANAEDEDGVKSLCSSTFVSYIEDSLVLPPVVSASNPVSPSNNNSPVISGTAEANSTVTLYSGSLCSSILTTTTADSSGNYSASVTLSDNSTVGIYAKAVDTAGNISTCSSTSVTYTEDSVAPAVATFSGTLPASPSDHNTPLVSGSAEMDSAVKLFSNSSCTTQVASGTANSMGTFSVEAPAVDDVTTNYYATVTDAAGNSSACSPTSQAYTAYSIPEGAAHLQGTSTTAASSNTNLNQATAYSIRWNTTSNYHSTYYSHSTATNPHQLKVLAGGNYFVALNVPIGSSTAGASVRAEIRVNGTVVDHARAESAYISNGGGHRESGLQLFTLLKDLAANDVIDVTVIRAGASATVTVTSGSRASLYVEKVNTGKNIFFAKAVESVSSTNLNNTTASSLKWAHEIADVSYGHSDSLNPGEVVLDSGSYLLAVNLPLSSSTANTNVQVQVKKNGSLVSGGKASQGVIRGSTHLNSSAHWIGILNNVSAGDVLTIDVIREAAAGTVTVTSGKKASLYIESLNTVGIYHGEGSTLVSNNNWNSSTTAQNVKWTVDNLIDSAYFTHSTASNPNRVTFASAGSYLVLYQNSVSAAAANLNIRQRLKLSGTVISGAESKSTYISNSSGHTESSTAMAFFLRNMASGGYLEMESAREAGSGTVSSNGNAQLIIINRPLSVTP